MSEHHPISDSAEWIAYARGDLAAAEALAESPDVAPVFACFHCQQSVEKALKAVLISRDQEFPYTHNLRVLANMLPDDFPDEHLPDLEQLTVYAVHARYPSDFGVPTIEDAIAAIRDSRYILETIEQYLGSGS